MAGSKPIVWRVEIAPEEFKPFDDCNRDELEAAAALVKDRAGSRDLSTAGELHEDDVARLGLMEMTDLGTLANLGCRVDQNRRGAADEGPQRLIDRQPRVPTTPETESRARYLCSDSLT